jgi:hypothetical protein
MEHVEAAGVARAVAVFRREFGAEAAVVAAVAAPGRVNVIGSSFFARQQIFVGCVATATGVEDLQDMFVTRVANTAFIVLLLSLSGPQVNTLTITTALCFRSPSR